MTEAYSAWSTIKNQRRARAYLNAYIKTTGDTSVTVQLDGHCNCDLIASYGVRIKLGADDNGWDTGVTGVCSSGSNIAYDSRSVSYNRTHNNYTKAFYCQLSGETVNGYGGITGGTVQAKVELTIPAKSSWTVSYNANGGSGAPGAQTKWHSETLTLSSTVPTRTGYTFKGWATSASGSVAYAAGASYTANSGATLYAVWQELTYTIKYNANGGSGAPSNQTKYYTTNLALSSTKPTRSLYTFQGWATSANGTVQYAAGATYSTNADITLYAVWKLAYTAPKITGLTAYRCNSDGSSNDDGTYIKVTFNWSTFNSSYPSTSVTATCGSSSNSGTAGGTSGSYSYVFSGMSNESAFTITATVKDSQGSTSQTQTVGSASYIIDVSPQGGVGIGTVAPATKGDLTVSGTGTFGKQSATSWQKGRDTAPLKVIPANVKAGRFSPALTYKCPTGSWEIGGVNWDDNLNFVYNSDSNYASGSDVYNYFIRAGKAAGYILTQHDFIDAIYPVGAVYISYVSTSPASLFGGSWTQITGKFLRMANDVSTGGADTHTLTVAQMPSHKHAFCENNSSGSSSGWAASMVNGKYITQETMIQAAGSGNAHNNMPSYQDLYAWRRTA